MNMRDNYKVVRFRYTSKKLSISAMRSVFTNFSFRYTHKEEEEEEMCLVPLSTTTIITTILLPILCLVYEFLFLSCYRLPV